MLSVALESAGHASLDVAEVALLKWLAGQGIREGDVASANQEVWKRDDASDVEAAKLHHAWVEVVKTALVQSEVVRQDWQRVAVLDSVGEWKVINCCWNPDDAASCESAHVRNLAVQSRNLAHG